MSEYLDDVEGRFDPMDYITPGEEEMEEALPDNPTAEEVIEAERTLTSGQERGGAILTSEILAELRALSKRVRQRMDEVERSGANEWAQEQKDDVHLFFAFVGQAQEYLLRESVMKHVISDEAATESMKEKIISDDSGRAMSAGECIDFLHRGGFIDDGLKGEIYQTRNERNEAVHDIRRWFFAHYDPHELEPQITRGERSVVRLLELTYGFDLE